jgi:hypothetical protein
MYKGIAHVRFPTHQAHISTSDDGVIHVFKYSDHGCDLSEFTNPIEAGDYILEPISRHHYTITWSEPEDEWLPSIIHPKNLLK